MFKGLRSQSFLFRVKNSERERVYIVYNRVWFVY